MEWLCIQSSLALCLHRHGGSTQKAGIEFLHWCMDSLLVSMTVTSSPHSLKQIAGTGVRLNKCMVVTFSLLLMTLPRTEQSKLMGLPHKQTVCCWESLRLTVFRYFWSLPNNESSRRYMRVGVEP